MLRRESSDLAPPTAFFTSLKHPCDPPGRETGTQNNRRHDAVPLSMHEERRGNEIEERACLGLFSREWNSDTNDLDSQAFASGRMIAVSNLRRQSSALEPPSSFFSDLSRCLPLDEPDADGLTSLGFEDWGGTGDSRCGTDQDATDTGQRGVGAACGDLCAQRAAPLDGGGRQDRSSTFTITRLQKVAVPKASSIDPQDPQ